MVSLNKQPDRRAVPDGCFFLCLGIEGAGADGEEGPLSDGNMSRGSVSGLPFHFHIVISAFHADIRVGIDAHSVLPLGEIIREDECANRRGAERHAHAGILSGNPFPVERLEQRIILLCLFQALPFV